MKQWKQYLKKKKYILLFLVALITFGSIVGVILSLSNLPYLQDQLSSFTNQYMTTPFSYLLIHFFFLILSLFLSFFGVGIALLCTLLFYEGMSIGFLFSLFSASYGLSGFFFAGCFYLITKGFYLVFLSLYFCKCLEISRKMIGKFLYKTDPSLYLKRLLASCAILIVATLLTDLLIFFFGHKILTIFRFLLN